MFAPIPVTQQDAQINNQAIYKLQYTKSLGSNALFKVYGYTYYSNWMQNGPNTTWSNYIGCCSPDYELSSHTRGISGTFTDQLGSKNLVSLEGSATTATTTRDNNTQNHQRPVHALRRARRAERTYGRRSAGQRLGSVQRSVLHLDRCADDVQLPWPGSIRDDRQHSERRERSGSGRCDDLRRRTVRIPRYRQRSLRHVQYGQAELLRRRTDRRVPSD